MDLTVRTEGFMVFLGIISKISDSMRVRIFKGKLSKCCFACSGFAHSTSGYSCRTTPWLALRTLHSTASVSMQSVQNVHRVHENTAPHVQAKSGCGNPAAALFYVSFENSIRGLEENRSYISAFGEALYTDGIDENTATGHRIHGLDLVRQRISKGAFGAGQ